MEALGYLLVPLLVWEKGDQESEAGEQFFVEHRGGYPRS